MDSVITKDIWEAPEQKPLSDLTNFDFILWQTTVFVHFYTKNVYVLNAHIWTKSKQSIQRDEIKYK